MATEELDLNKLQTSEEIVKSNVANLELYADNHPFRLSLRIKTFESEAEFKKFIRNVEVAIRRSVEYKEWKKYIIDILGIKSCMITNERIDECSIEVHHHIPSLYVLVKSIVNKRIEERNEFTTFDIALDAMKLHFENKIGYAMLVQSMHEKFHNGFLQIPKEYVKGDFMAFINKYSKYLEDADLELINIRLATTESNCNWSRENYPGVQVSGG